MGCSYRVVAALNCSCVRRVAYEVGDDPQRPSQRLLGAGVRIGVFPQSSFDGRDILAGSEAEIISQRLM